MLVQVARGGLVRRPRWFAGLGMSAPTLRGPLFDSSNLMVTAAEAGLGIALVPTCMFLDKLMAERLVQPFASEVDLGGYWLTRLQSRQKSEMMQRFSAWMFAEPSDQSSHQQEAAWVGSGEAGVLHQLRIPNLPFV